MALLQLIEAGHADLDPETQAALMPGAGGISRAGQGVRFYRALLDEGEGPGGRMLSPEMVRAAAFPHAVGSVDRTFETDIPWRLGFHLKHVRPTLDDCGGTATPGTFGHGGHFLVNTAWRDPGKGLAGAADQRRARSWRGRQQLPQRRLLRRGSEITQTG